jgi:hypothetical protein
VQMLRALLDGHPVAQASRLHPSRSVPNLQGLRKINQIKKNIHTKVHKNRTRKLRVAQWRQGGPGPATQDLK